VLLDVIDILLRSPVRNHPYPLHVRFIDEAAVDLSGLKPELMNILGHALFGAYEEDDELTRTGAAADLDEEGNQNETGPESVPADSTLEGHAGGAADWRETWAQRGDASSFPYPQSLFGAEIPGTASQTSIDERSVTARVTADQLSRLRKLNANVIIGEANTVCPSPQVGVVIAYCMGWCIGKCLFHSIALDAQLSKMFLALLIEVPPRISDIAEFDPGLAKLIQQAEVDDTAFSTLRENVPGLTGQWYRTIRCKVGCGPPTVDGESQNTNWNTNWNANSHPTERLRIIDTRKVVLARHYPRGAETIQSATKGFYGAIPDPASYFLDVDLLHSTVVGRPVIDVVDWRANSVVQGFAPDCLVPEWFWDILESHPRVRAEVLHFACGIRAPPQEGFAALGRPLFKSEAAYPFTLRPCAAKELPTAHTCTNTLELPLVKSRRELLVALRKSLFYGKTMDIV